MTGAASTVFVLDRSSESRIALSHVLTGVGYSVRSYESTAQFLTEQDDATPGCLLIDLYMGGLGGLALQRVLAGSPVARPIVFLTDGGDIETSVQAMKAGAVDFLTKPIDNLRLIAAIDQALRRDAEQRLARAFRHIIQQRFETLTPRERQVMEHVMRGRLNKQIAAEIGIGEKTVKIHRGRVMSKMAVRSVAALVHLGVRLGLVAFPLRVMH